MIRVYLSSRVAKDARTLNDIVAAELARAGYESVFVPHHADHNSSPAPHVEVYHKDMSEMRRADVCVVVGRVGVDCAFEVGWFSGRGIPVCWLTQEDPADHPMFAQVVRCSSMADVLKFLEANAGGVERA